MPLFITRERLDDFRTVVDDFDARINWDTDADRRDKLELVVRCRELIADLETFLPRGLPKLAGTREPEVIRFNVPRNCRR